LSCSVGSARLLEDLSRDLDPRPGMRVLDLGREFGVEVVAVDLWVSPYGISAQRAIL
jgi:hypothetical protein